jgi:hypothetical protein
MINDISNELLSSATSLAISSFFKHRFTVESREARALLVFLKALFCASAASSLAIAKTSSFFCSVQPLPHAMSESCFRVSSVK